VSSGVTKQDLDKEAKTKFRPFLFFKKRQTKSEYKMSLRPSGKGRTKGRVKKDNCNRQCGPKL